jgi:hypothetical protein
MIGLVINVINIGGFVMDDLTILEIIRYIYLSSKNYDGDLKLKALCMVKGIEWEVQTPKIKKSNDGKNIDVTFSFNVHDRKEVSRRINKIENQWFIDEIA